jgi:hypothetical protein
VTNEVKTRLQSIVFPSLEEMMEGYAAAAVGLARQEYNQLLDYSAESIDLLDEILVLVGETPDHDLDFEVRLWGSYLGEVLRRRYSGSWEMTSYPGGTSAVPSVEVRGSRLFPLIKVYRRLTAGDEDDLRSFYTMVTDRLGKPAQVN